MSLSKGWPRLDINNNAWDGGRRTIGLHVLYDESNELFVSRIQSNITAVANNFWGKDDAGVQPMLDRMHGSKVTSDELKAFYAGTGNSTSDNYQPDY